MGPADSIAVTAIWTTPVKGLRLHPRTAVEFGPLGVRENRCFFLVDAKQRLVNGKRVGALTSLRADYDADAEALTLILTDGTELTEPVRDGAPLTAQFFSRTQQTVAVCPELSRAISDVAASELTLVRADPSLTACDRGPGGAVSLMSRASLAHLSQLAGEDVDPRRFRMLLEIDGLGAHGEDALVGERVRIGDALVHFGGHVGRCRVTSMDPDSGAVTLPTLDLLSYRKGLDTTEPLAFGIYGDVLEPGGVRVGDRVSVEPLARVR